MSLRATSFVFAAFAALSLNAEEIRISASDLLADFITAPLNAYGAEHETDFVIDGIGSLPALDRLRSNEVDLAIIAVPEGDSVPREEFRVYPFAYDIAVVAVNVGNPIDEITIGRLGGIFGVNEEYNFNTWGELGLSGWGSRMIKPLVGQNGKSISFELFKYSVLKGGVMKPGVTMVKDSEVEDSMLSDGGAIAILSRMPKSQKIKALMVAKDSSSPAFGPSEDNVHYGDYPIRLAFYIAYNERNDEKMKDLLRVLFSEETAESLRQNNLLALPSTIRRKLMIDLDLQN